MTDSASDSGRPATQTWGGIVQRSNGAMPELPDRWAPVRLLGEGGQAEVWLAEDLELGEPVAVKVFHANLSPAARERLRREVRLGRALQHPGLVRVFELIEAGDRLAIVMEWVPGGSLADRMQSGPLPIPEVIEAARQALEALSALHVLQVLHRDIKPSNLLLDAHGRIKLADLGLARSLSQASDITRTHTAVGTPAYMSPEQLLGRDPQAASDLYALGATLFELVAGRRPFAAPLDGGGDPRLTARAGSPRRYRSDCPRWLAHFIRRLLEREPRDRFTDAACALATFERRRLLVSPRLRRRLVAGAIATCLVCAAGFAVWDRTRATLSTVTVSGSEVVSADSRGRELWRRSYEGLQPVVTLADLTGDARKEVVVQLRQSPAGLPESFQDLRVLSSEGRELAAVASSLSAFSRFFPGMSPRLSASTVHPLDLDGDGRPDLVWVTAHAQWYPTVVGAWNLRDGSQPKVLFVNSGSVHGLVPVDLDADGKQEILAYGINNPLGFQLAVALIKPEPAVGSHSRAVSPDLSSAYLGESGFSSVLAFNVLGPFGGKPEITMVDPQGLLVRTSDRSIRVDSTLNPEGSPAFGQGSQGRDAFWNEIAESCLRIEAGDRTTAIEPPGFEARHASILKEPPMRQASILLLGRALARSGRQSDAVTWLTQALGQLPDSLDIWMRLGNRQATLGQYDAALRSLARATRGGSRGRPPVDAIVSRVLITSLQGNEVAFAEALRHWQIWQVNRLDDPVADDLKGIHAFCRSDWTDPSLASERPDPITPVLPCLRAWAAFRRSGDASAARGLTQGLLEEPETAPFARLLLAEVALQQHTPTLAVDLATSTLAEIELHGRESWEVFAWVALAERVLGDALTAAGRSPDAAPHLARARHLAPGAWFGGRGSGSNSQLH